MRANTSAVYVAPRLLRRRSFAFALVVCVCAFVCAAARVAAAPAPHATAADICTNNNVYRDGRISLLCVKVMVVEGRPKVDPVTTRLFLREEFLNRLSRSKLTRERVQKLLLDRVDRALTQSNRLIHYALTPDERKAVHTDGCKALADKEAGALCQLNATWEGFISRYDTWQQTRPAAAKALTRPPVFERLLVNADVERYLGEINFDSPLYYTDRVENTSAADGGTGLLLMRVADPIGNPASDEYKVCIDEKCDGKSSDEPRTVAAPGDIRRVLKRLVGRLWDKSEIEAVVQEFYAGKGLLATIVAGDPFENPKTITVKESPRIISISFASDLKRDEMVKAMYLLLPDKQFRRLVKCEDELLEPDADDPLKLIVVEMLDLTAAGECSSPDTDGAERPYLNLLKFQIQKLQLNSIDLDAGIGERTEDEETFVFIQVVKASDAEDEGEKKKGENDKAVPLANPEGVIDRNLTRPESQTSLAPRVTVEHTPTATPTPSHTGTTTPTPTPTPDEPEDEGKGGRKNYVGGGFEYRSGQGVRAIGIYQRDRLLFSNDGFSLKVGGHDEPLGSVNYYADYVGFGKLHRRLMLQLTGSSEVNAQRLFADRETDERRTGALARAEFELFRDRGGSLLRFFLGAQRMTVELKEGEQTVGKQNLSTLDLGALYMLQPDYERDYPRWARLEPRVRFGLGLASGERRFNAFFLSGNFHQKLPGYFEVDVSGRVGLASRDTPLFEQPSLGGADSVRGFRQDEAIGRRIWSVQPELWVPLPGTTGSAGEFQRFLLRSVRLTAFADVGGAYKTAGTQPGVRFAPGTGLRLIFDPVVLKLDWAYGLSSVDTTTGRGRVSFSMATNLPF